MRAWAAILLTYNPGPCLQPSYSWLASRIDTATGPLCRTSISTLAPGAIACLLGPSGCGKTTLLRLIAGFERPESGTIALDGTVISSPERMVAPEHRHMGMVFQDFALFPHLTVSANIGFGLDKEQRPARVAELLALTGLEGLGDRYPHQISGGQQQRVALARALAPRPRLVLLDEPFSSLDVSLRERLAGEVRQILLREGTAAILVTHDQHEAFAFADEIGVVRDGRIEQWATGLRSVPPPGDPFRGGLHRRRNVRGRASDALGHRDRTRPADRRGADGRNALATPEHLDVLLRPDDVVHDDAGPCRAEVVVEGVSRSRDPLHPAPGERHDRQRARSESSRSSARSIDRHPPRCRPRGGIRPGAIELNRTGVALRKTQKVIAAFTPT